MLIFFIVAFWWTIGVAGFVFWWTKEHNLKLADMILGFGVGFLGPFSWVYGYLIHGQSHEFMSKVVVKKRVANEKGVGE